MKLLVTACLLAIPQEKEKLPLKVLYIGNIDTPRGREYVELFKAAFRECKGADRKGFDPKTAADFDVVILDWSQQDQSFRELTKVASPLGERDAWTKPTVLLGSAGLLLAGKWRLSGTWG